MLRNSLICALGAATLSAVSPLHNAKPIDIDSNVLHAVDGTPFIKIHEMIHFVKELDILLLGERKEQRRIGIFIIDGIAMNLTQAVAYFAEHGDSNPALYRQIFNEAFNFFEKAAEPYYADIGSSKAFMIELIRQWSVQRQLTDSPLLEWSNVNGDEKAAARKNIKTLEELENFVQHLRLFMIDLTCSCKKSFRYYKELLAQQKAHGSPAPRDS